ncbi:late embryogenesis abundant protein At1g64065 [Ipomoea triloba]|uniref:late embryogenesis abundant protein At1g64065 n=1 Tax=Ipomoea triloba TaxID=35885 RepID=UPI00125D6DBE|nr:late embryogenesis abundant protein At1g64065 [Ipomoea triloba]
MSSPPPSPGSAMAAKEQVRPLASHRYLHVDVENDGFSVEVKKTRHRHYHGKCIKFCGCCTAVLLVVAVAIIVLASTVFHVKDPTIKMNTIRIEGLSFLSTGNLNPGVNLTLVSDLSVKNPNAASFKFNDAAETSLLYGGKVVGEAKIPAGNARARRTLQLNVTVDVMVEKLLEVPRLKSDLVTGELPVAIYTTIHGKVKVLRIVKKSATLKMNCSMSFNILRQDIENLDCLNSL